MDIMLVGPDWLWVACANNRVDHGRARTIYRAFIKVAKTYGHVMDLDREESRRQIQHGFRHRRLATCTVPCVRCHCVAWLGDWISASNMTLEQAQCVIDDHPDRARAHMLDFLAFCPGGDYKQVTYERTQPPEVL